ncbi:MAG: protein kinase [Candidatus Saccharimonas sp.]
MTEVSERVLVLNNNDELDEFFIESFINEGLSKTARTYRAKDGVALKLFVLEEANSDFEFRYNKFKNEVELLKKLEPSDHVVNVLTELRGEGVHNGIKKIAHYYAMEHMDGDLESLILNKDFSIEQKLAFVRQILTGVIDFHNEGIGHRDLYTPNVLFKEIEGEYTFKIADFGSAKEQGSQQQVAYFFPTGILKYSSPESLAGLLGGDDVDIEILKVSDIYSFGLIMYELLTSERQEVLNSTLASIMTLARDAGVYGTGKTQQERVTFLETQAVPHIKLATIKDISSSAILASEEVAAELTTLFRQLIEPDYHHRMTDLKLLDEKLKAIQLKVGGTNE